MEKSTPRISDLSQHHAPLTELFPRLTKRSACGSFRLSVEQIAFFQTSGYLGGVPMLERRQLEALRSEVDDIVKAPREALGLLYEHNGNESDDPQRRLFHCLGHWRIAPALHDLLWHPAFTIPAAQLLDGPVRFWHDQLFVKPAHDGGVVAWHQDYSYWTRTKPMAHLTAWIALDDATRDNGCVHFVPGSQRWPLLPKPRLAGDMQAIRSVLSEEQLAAFRPVASELEAGFASFHHPLMLHGSFANPSARPRRGVVVNVVRDGVASDSDAPLLESPPSQRAAR